MSTNYVVYILIDPKDNAIHYVGMTRFPHRRLAQHISEYKGDEKSEWIRNLSSSKLKPILKIVEDNLTAEEADARETYWIKYYQSQGATLYNVAKAKSTRLSYLERYPQLQNGEWLPMNQVAKTLGIRYSTLSRLALGQVIQSRKDEIFDRRTVLVNINEVKRVFELE